MIDLDLDELRAAFDVDEDYPIGLVGELTTLGRQLLVEALVRPN
ncbi:MAG: hypothetical protein ABSD03_15785 [Vulcanimicrobiaceae bacterium]|jgi:hypothetical protein